MTKSNEEDNSASFISLTGIFCQIGQILLRLLVKKKKDKNKRIETCNPNNLTKNVHEENH